MKISKKRLDLRKYWVRLGRQRLNLKIKHIDVNLDLKAGCQHELIYESADEQPPKRFCIICDEEEKGSYDGHFKILTRKPVKQITKEEALQKSWMSKPIPKRFLK